MKIQAPDRPLARDLLDGPGYALWCAELLDDQGSGVSLTWGFGHPEARAGEAGPARGVPSLAVRVFALGAPALSIHQRFPEGGWFEPMGRWTFGDSQIEALRDLKAQVVIARLKLKLPGAAGFLEGHVELGAIPRRAPAEIDVDEPLALDVALLSGPGEGRAILQAGGRNFHLKGRAAHARFGARAPRPLRWLRAPFADEERWIIEDDAGAAGLIVDLEGRGAAIPLERDGDVYRGEGGEAFLKLEEDAAIQARPLGAERRLRVRAPMKLPVVALLHEIGAGDAERARHFVHHAGARNPRRALVENGVIDDRAWRRRFSLSSR